MKPHLISLFDYTGNASRPFRENGWNVTQIDLQHGMDILEWDFIRWYNNLNDYILPSVGIIAMIPCTDYALSGAKHFARKDADGSTEYSQKLTERTKHIIDYFDNVGTLRFWQVENPMSRIHKLNPWLGSPVLKFNPCDYACYDPIPENSRYNKMTWLWGNFNIPEKKRIEPHTKDYPGFRNAGGKSLKTKNMRSITPLGFAYKYNNLNRIDTCQCDDPRHDRDVTICLRCLKPL